MMTFSLKHAVWISIIGAAVTGCAVGTGEESSPESASSAGSAVTTDDTDVTRPVGDLGDTCGGLLGITCKEGLYCQNKDGMCQVRDATGTCAVRSRVCTDQYVPVCGCDGHTYGNSCAAASVAMQIAYRGECQAPCDFEHVDADVSEVVGTWTRHDDKGFAEIDETLTVSAEAQYRIFETITRKCDPGPCPLTAAPVTVLKAYGRVGEGAGSFILQPHEGSSPSLFRSFEVQKNCRGARRVAAKEIGPIFLTEVPHTL